MQGLKEVERKDEVKEYKRIKRMRTRSTRGGGRGQGATHARSQVSGIAYWILGSRCGIGGDFNVTWHFQSSLYDELPRL